MTMSGHVEDAAFPWSRPMTERLVPSLAVLSLWTQFGDEAKTVIASPAGLCAWRRWRGDNVSGGIALSVPGLKKIYLHCCYPEDYANNHPPAERVNSDLKDNHGGRHVRVKGQAKVYAHLMFGLLVVTVSNLHTMLS